MDYIGKLYLMLTNNSFNLSDLTININFFYRLSNLVYTIWIFSVKWQHAVSPVSYTHLDVYKRQASYRCLCIVDRGGKLFKKIRSWSRDCNAGEFSDRQYGFRKERSTADAIKTVVVQMWWNKEIIIYILSIFWQL